MESRVDTNLGIKVNPMHGFIRLILCSNGCGMDIAVKKERLLACVVLLITRSVSGISIKRDMPG